MSTHHFSIIIFLVCFVVVCFACFFSFQKKNRCSRTERFKCWFGQTSSDIQQAEIILNMMYAFSFVNYALSQSTNTLKKCALYVLPFHDNITLTNIEAYVLCEGCEAQARCIHLSTLLSHSGATELDSNVARERRQNDFSDS